MCINELRKLGRVTENYLSLNVQERGRYVKIEDAKKTARPQNLSVTCYSAHTHSQ